MSLALTAALCAATAALAAFSLMARRRHRGAFALGGAGALAGALLAGMGFPGLAAGTLAAALAVAAAGLVVGRRLSEVERQSDRVRPRGPWLLALVASGLLALALGLGIAVTDWPRPPAGTAPGALPVGAPAAPPAAAGARPAPAGLTDWALGALAVAAGLALGAFAPRAPEE